jgi:hypothetical protein
MEYSSERLVDIAERWERVNCSYNQESTPRDYLRLGTILTLARVAQHIRGLTDHDIEQLADEVTVNFIKQQNNWIIYNTAEGR